MTFFVLFRTSVWQKALNCAVEEGIKVENHSKLIRMVRDWKDRAKRNDINGIQLATWEKNLLEIFETDDDITCNSSIKEEIIDESADLWADTTKSMAAAADNAGLPVAVPDAIKLVIAKAMLRHRQLIFSEAHQESGWRKVYRVAQGNGAFYDSIDSMRTSINMWKSRALVKLSKDPNAITELDKLMYTIFTIDTGDLDLDMCCNDT